MSGHSHWAGIKHQKGAADAKRAKVFSKLLMAIRAAAKGEANPDFNPRLRTAVEKAKEANVPGDAIARAIKGASEAAQTEELLYEAYGPGSAAILIMVITDNRNRAAQAIKMVLNNNGGKWAESGSVRWAFEAQGDAWRAKFPQELNPADKAALDKLVEALLEEDEVQKVFTNA